MQVKILIGTVAFMLTMVLLGFYSLLEPTRMANFTDARVGRQIEAGAEVFYANCATCHGINGDARECYDAATGEPIACAGLPLNYNGLLCGDTSARMTARGWIGTKYGFVHDTVASGRQGGIMAAWAQEYGGPLQENEVENVTLFVLNWETEELCAQRIVLYPWPDPADDPNAAWAAATSVTEAEVRTANGMLDTDALTFALPIAYPGDAARGEELYKGQYACTACHGVPEEQPAGQLIGPWHGDVAVNAANRIAGVGPEAYIYQSLLIPDAYVVEGYANAMASYRDQTGASPQDMMDIITYLMTHDGQ